MRRALLSVAVLTATGALLAAGGAFSLFNDTASSAAPFTNGTVKLSVNGQHPLTDIFALAGPCTQRFQDATSPTDALNLGTLNNTGCTSTFTVHNSGSLPFELSGTTVTDTKPSGLACFTSTITPADITKAAVLPGADRVLHVSTATSSDDKACQGVYDKVSVALLAVETTPDLVTRCYDASDAWYADLDWNGGYGADSVAHYHFTTDGTCSGVAYYSPVVLRRGTVCNGYIEPRYWGLPDDAVLCDVL